MYINAKQRQIIIHVRSYHRDLKLTAILYIGQMPWDEYLTLFETALLDRYHKGIHVEPVTAGWGVGRFTSNSTGQPPGLWRADQLGGDVFWPQRGILLPSEEQIPKGKWDCTGVRCGGQLQGRNWLAMPRCKKWRTDKSG